jgi:hypothetical protein
MKLWLVMRTDNYGYDDFDSMVVRAESADAARQIHPRGHFWPWPDTSARCWTEAQHLDVEYLGEATEGAQPGVVCASFNAG